MKRTSIFLLAALLALGVGLGGCKKDGGGKTEEKVVWPSKPADGAPVAVVFLKLKERGGKLRAGVRFFNFSDKAVKKVHMNLDYLDAGGKKLQDFPWSQMDMGNLVEAKAHKDATVGAFLPKETKRVEAQMKSVEFADGSKWEAAK